MDGLLLPPAASSSSGSGLPRSLSTPQPAKISALRIGVIGFGTFGQFLARRWRRRGHEVFAQSRSDYSEAAAAMGATYVKTAEELVGQSIDVLVVSVSVLSFEAVLKRLPAELLKSTLVVDVLSVKQYAKSTMLSLLPKESDILCTHPMFGPESGKGSWQGLPCVFEQVRVSDFHRCARFVSLFEEEGCRMVRVLTHENASPKRSPPISSTACPFFSHRASLSRGICRCG